MGAKFSSVNKGESHPTELSFITSKIPLERQEELKQQALTH
jgi:hypothetical protein